MSAEEKRKPIKLIDDPSELPTDLNDEEEAEFWETHGLSEEFLDKTEELPAAERPRRREKATPISVRFDASTLDRLRALAEQKGVGYQTLLKQFVGERLYEEEKREGLISAPEDPQPAKQAAGQSQHAAGSLTVTDQVGQVAGQAQEVAGQAAQQAQEVAGQVMQQAQDAADQVTDQATDQAGQVADQAQDSQGLRRRN